MHRLVKNGSSARRGVLKRRLLHVETIIHFPQEDRDASEGRFLDTDLCAKDSALNVKTRVKVFISSRDPDLTQGS